MTSPLAAPGAPAPNWERRAYILLGLLFVWRLVFIAIAPLDLAPDEAYYWDWSRHPAWGYYSKPPLIAWINMLSSGLLPVSVFSVRLPAAIFSLLSLLAIHGLARRLFSSRTAFWAVAATVAAPGNCALGYVMTIDAPLFCFWSIALYCLWRALEDTPGHLRWWLAAALAAAFGVLAKQMMLVFLLLAPLFLLISREDRRHLSTPGPYVLTVLTLAALLPPLGWNMEHDWITFKHTAHHFESHSEGAFYLLKTSFDFISGQMLLVSPLSCFLLILLAFFLVAGFKLQGRKVRFLLLFSGISLLGFLLLSLRQRVNANWPAVFYPAGMILLAAWGNGEISSDRRFDRWRKLFIPGVLVGALFALLTYSLPFFLETSRLGGSRLDPTGEVKGWRQLALEVEKVRSELKGKEKIFLVAAKRQVVSELAFYLPDRPRVYKFPGPKNGINSQYDLWEQPTDKNGMDGLIVLNEGMSLPDELAGAFVSFRKLKELEIPLGPGGSRHYNLYVGRGLKEWPY